MNRPLATGRPRPARYLYPTVEVFVNEVAAASKPEQLTGLWSRLRLGSNNYEGFHPFKSGSDAYVACWKALRKKAAEKQWGYDVQYFKFYEPARA